MTTDIDTTQARLHDLFGLAAYTPRPDPSTPLR